VFAHTILLFRNEKLEQGALLTENYQWRLAANTFFIAQERHLQAIVLSLRPVTLQWRKLRILSLDEKRVCVVYSLNVEWSWINPIV
jgi:hypothetical protein